MQRNSKRVALSAVLSCSIVLLISPAHLRAEDDAGKIYKTNCVLCHSANGSGDSPTGKAMKAKDLRSDDVQKSSDSDLAGIVTNGKGKMPAFGKKLSPDAIKSLVAYIRALPKS
jgi:mono/diheme cytochrome c family protein